MNDPEAVAWLEDQIELGEFGAASGGWLPPAEGGSIAGSGLGFQMPEEMYAQMLAFTAEAEERHRQLIDELPNYTWTPEGPIPGWDPDNPDGAPRRAGS